MAEIDHFLKWTSGFQALSESLRLQTLGEKGMIGYWISFAGCIGEIVFKMNKLC
jgi:hypothetical protein